MDDAISETTEEFSVRLTLPVAGTDVQIRPSEAIIEITDDDGTV